MVDFECEIAGQAVPAHLVENDFKMQCFGLPLSWFVATGAFAVAASATPGPNNTMVTASGANFGLRRTLPHIIGVTAGFPIMLSVLGIGAAHALASSPLIHQLLRLVGVAYMVWLAVHIARADAHISTDGVTRAKPLNFFQALFFQFVNPKGVIVAASTIVTYTLANRSIILQVGLLDAMFLCITPLALAGWTLVGVGAQRFLRTPRLVRRFNYAMAALLLASVVPLFFE